MLSYIYSDILSDTSSDILRGIPVWLYFDSGIPVWQIFWRSIWHLIWHIFWHTIWHCIRSFYLESETLLNTRACSSAFYIFYQRFSVKLRFRSTGLSRRTRGWCVIPSLGKSSPGGETTWNNHHRAIGDGSPLVFFSTLVLVTQQVLDLHPTGIKFRTCLFDSIWAVLSVGWYSPLMKLGNGKSSMQHLRIDEFSMVITRGWSRTNSRYTIARNHFLMVLLGAPNHPMIQKQPKGITKYG